MKQRLLIVVLALSLSCALAACGGGSGVDDYSETAGVVAEYSMMMDSVESEADSSLGLSSPSNGSSSSSSAKTAETAENKQTEKISKDMLVYTGDIHLTTKEYDKSVEAFGNMLEEYDCFIEESNEWTNGDYYGDDIGLREYSSTIRVESAKYDDFLNGVSGIGTVRSKEQQVENLKVEYSDAVTALEIYEAKYERYLNLLETVTDEQYALQIESELTDLSIQIAQLKSRKSGIETDVAYSYVYVRIEEVKEFERQVSHDDTFLERLWMEIGNTFFGFVEFLEGFLFLLIRLSPYVLFFGGICLALKAAGLFRWTSERKARKANERALKTWNKTNSREIPMPPVKPPAEK